MRHVLRASVERRKGKIRHVLSQVFGIGRFLSNQICDKLGFSQSLKVEDLQTHHFEKIGNIMKHYYFADSELKRLVQTDIKRLIQCGTYRGLRHQTGMPVKGQRTRSNAKIAKSLNRTRL
jgi:small subunit ribosomal protein S13